MSDFRNPTLARSARGKAWIWCLIIAGVLVALVLAAPALKSYRESLHSRAQIPFEDARLKLQHPGNWKPMPPKDTAEGVSVASFHIPDVGTLAVTLTDSAPKDQDLTGLLDTALALNAKNFQTKVRETGAFTTWGVYTGVGKQASMTVDGGETVLRVFCSALPDGRTLFVQEIGVTRVIDDLQPQFEVVRQSLEIKPAETESPPVAP